MMAAETANVVLVVIIIIVFFMLMSACCRQLRTAYDQNLTAEEHSRRRQAFFISGAPVGGAPEEVDEESRSVRVTAISHGGGDRVFGVYEIRVPRRPPSGRLFGRGPPPPPFQTALQNSSPIYYVDPEEPPPSYDEYLKTQPNSQKEINKF